MTSDNLNELDVIQSLIWARIKDEADKEGIRLTLGNCYSLGACIKDVLHPEVKALIATKQKEARLEENAWSRGQMIAMQVLEASNSGFGRQTKLAIKVLNHRKIKLLKSEGLNNEL